MALSPRFHIQHVASGRFVHPKGGSISVPVTGHSIVSNWVVIYDGLGPQTRFYFDFAEPPWGYIVSDAQPDWCIHPKGGALDPGDYTDLVFHRDRHRGAMFTYDAGTQQFRHMGGSRNWHPKNNIWDNNNGVILHRGHHDGTKFRITNSDGFPVSLTIPSA